MAGRGAGQRAAGHLARGVRVRNDAGSEVFEEGSVGKFA